MVHVILFSIIGLGFLTRKSSKIIQAIPFVALFLFASLRYMYGNDYSSYLKCYNQIQTGLNVFDNEYLYIWLNQTFSSFFSLIAFISLFFVISLYFLITKNVPSEYRCLSIFILVISPYLFLMNLSAIRQSIATIIFMVAIRFAIKKHYIVYILFILLATLFHQSAIVLLPFVFIINERRFDKKYTFLFLAILSTLLITDNFSDILENLASNFENTNYLHYAQEGATNSLRATLLSSVSLIYALLNIGELKGTDLVYGKLYIISTTFAVLAIKQAHLTRIGMYFDIFAIVALPVMFKHNLEKGKVVIERNKLFTSIVDIAKRYVLPALILVIYLLRYYSFFVNPLWEKFATYQTIFSAQLF